MCRYRTVEAGRKGLGEGKGVDEQLRVYER